MNKKYFYVEVKKKDEESLGKWYNDFVGEVFLVKNDVVNKKLYVLADGCAWIDKKHAERVEAHFWSPI